MKKSPRTENYLPALGERLSSSFMKFVEYDPHNENK